MEIFQQCLTEALKFVLLAAIAGLGYMVRLYLIPILKNVIDKTQKTAEQIGIELTAEQMVQAREMITTMVESAYRLKAGKKIDDAKEYVNTMAKAELSKIGIGLSDEMIDQIRRAALGELERTMEEWKTLVDM